MLPWTIRAAPAADGSRRRFLCVVATTMAGLTALPTAGFASVRGRGPKHPDPRPGITAAKVLPDSQVHNPDALPMFAMVR